MIHTAEGSAGGMGACPTNNSGRAAKAAASTAARWCRWARPCSNEPKRSGKLGWDFRIVSWASELGLPFETWGREWVLVIPRSARRNATGFEVMAGPRSAWTVSWPGAIPSRATVAALREEGRLPMGEEPADDISTEDVEQHVEIEPGPGRRPPQLGDIPTPQLIGPGSQELRRGVARMTMMRQLHTNRCLFGAPRTKLILLPVRRRL